MQGSTPAPNVVSQVKKEVVSLHNYSLPVELLEIVVSNTTVKELLNLRLMSKDMHTLVDKHAKQLMAKKRGIAMPTVSCGQVRCSCVQEIVGLDASLVRPLPVSVNADYSRQVSGSIYSQKIKFSNSELFIFSSFI